MGLGKNQNFVYLIDYGLSLQFYSIRTHEHIPYRNGKKLTGTTCYVSVNTHLGMEQSRRDDLESLGYVLVYMAASNLPWQGITAATKEEKHEKVKEMKLNTSLASLCKGLPEEMGKYVEYCRQLQFTEDPDYGHLRKLVKTMLMRKGEFYNYKYDWVLKAEAVENSKKPSKEKLREDELKNEKEKRKDLTTEERMKEARKYFLKAFNTQPAEDTPNSQRNNPN
eukprot:TRINITY_DN2494_c0_g1_i8.p1 TRINITY_DN2494_c0_g1~~TRINITY_DN2494_c0_g1_i8.p1  ORF type:complete len:223 (+),score=94.21 TRINITY_DN2494_c0_g1_i8:661-1329(+)